MSEFRPGDGQLHLDPDRARTAAQDLSGAGHDHLGARRRDGDAIAAATAARPWGRDDIGQAFDSHYRAAEQQVLDAWQTIALHIERLGLAAGATVADNLGADETSTLRLRQTFRP